MENHRKIWEEHNRQVIPRGYHIHHIDGNHTNNDPTNLVCVSPEEHFNIHLKQGDILCIRGKFIQGASEAGKKGGKIGGRKTKGKNKITDPARWEKAYKTRCKTIETKYGGIEPQTGMLKSTEFRKKISDATRGEKNPMFGKKHTEASIERIKQNTPVRTGIDNYMFGKHHTDEAKTKIRKKALGRLHREETKRAVSQTLRSQKNKWFNDGLHEAFTSAEKCPEGFKPGRLLKGKPRGTKITL
jgi:hypothetical protein